MHQNATVSSAFNTTGDSIAEISTVLPVKAPWLQLCPSSRRHLSHSRTTQIRKQRDRWDEESIICNLCLTKIKESKQQQDGKAWPRRAGVWMTKTSNQFKVARSLWVLLQPEFRQIQAYPAICYFSIFGCICLDWSNKIKQTLTSICHFQIICYLSVLATCHQNKPSHLLLRAGDAWGEEPQAGLKASKQWHLDLAHTSESKVCVTSLVL